MMEMKAETKKTNKTEGSAEPRLDPYVLFLCADFPTGSEKNNAEFSDFGFMWGIDCHSTFLQEMDRCIFLSSYIFPRMLMIESNLPLTLFIFDKESRAGTFIGILASVFNSKKLKTTSAKLKYFQFLGSSHSNNPYVTKSDFCWKISDL